jgi:protein transport protein SEC31
VQWCPRNPDLLATAFFDGTIGIHSIQSTDEVSQNDLGAATPQPDGADVFDNPSFARTNQASFTLKQPPKWLCRPTSASFGYSGQLVSVSNLGSKEGRHQSGVVHIRKLTTEDDIVARAERLRQAIDTQDLPAVAIERSAEAEAVAADSVGGWKALLSLFHADSRDELVTLLGFSKTEIAARVAEAIAKLRSAAEENTPLPVVKSPSDDEVSDAKPHGPVVSFAEPERSPPANVEDLLDATPSEVSAGAASDTSIVTPLPDAESTTTAPSLFGDDGPAGTPQLDAAADFFSTMGISRSTNEAVPVVPHTNYGIDSSVAATIGSRPSSAASDTLKNNTFYIYPADESETDRLVTKALVVGDFESAVSLCLSVERFADAILLAVKGGPELLARTQKAYFEKRTVALPYLRLFQSVVTNDLADIVQNADLQDWQEIFVVLCTFAGADEFGGLAEQLGARLEFQASLTRSEHGVGASELRKNAMLAYLAAGRLERLINIWIEELTEEEMRILADETASGVSRYTAHVHALQTFIEKVTVFRAAASYVDKDLEQKGSTGEDTAARTYKLSALYDRYFEYADFLGAQGLVKHAVAFLKLTPTGYKGAQGMQLEFAAGRERLLIAAGVSKEAPATSSSRIEVSAPAAAPTARAGASLSAPTAPSTVTTTTTSPSAYPYNPYAPAAQQHASSHATAAPPAPTSYPYAPTNVPPVANNPYAPVQPVQAPYQPTAPMTYPSGNAYSQPPQQQHGGQIAPPSTLSFGGPRATPPPVAPPPPPKRRENGGWNDAPSVAERRTPSGSANKPAAITSPFPNVGAAQGPVSNSMYSAPRGQSPAPAPPPPRPGSVQSRAPPPPHGRNPIPPSHMAAGPGPYPPAGPGPVPPLTHPPNAIPAGQQPPPPGQYAPPQRGPVTQPLPPPPPAPNPYSPAAPPPSAGALPPPPQARQVHPPPSAGPYGRVTSPLQQQPHLGLAPPLSAGPARVPPPPGPPQSAGGQQTNMPPPRAASHVQGAATPKYRKLLTLILAEAE